MTAPGPAATHAASFDYALWKELLGAIVTSEGKVDYWDEVRQHTSPGDLWLVIDNKVYDVVRRESTAWECGKHHQAYRCQMSLWS